MIRAYEEQIAAIEARRRRADPDGEPRARPRSPRRRTTTQRSTTASWRRCSEPVILHWLGDMFDPALAGYWGTADRRRGDGHRASASSTPTPPRSTASRSRCSTRTRRSPCAGASPEGVRMYTGDDFNYAELIAGDEHGYLATRCSASSTRSRRRPRAALVGARERATVRRFHDDPRADGAAVAPHLPGADALLQDRRRLPGLAQRPPGPFHDGRRPAERALAAPPRRAVPARRRAPACCAIRSAPPSACARDGGTAWLAVHGHPGR